MKKKRNKGGNEETGRERWRGEIERKILSYINRYKHRRIGMQGKRDRAIEIQEGRDRPRQCAFESGHQTNRDHDSQIII